jgi:hypothetical protein
MLTTEHEFTLPLGLVDSDGTLHRDGVMRLATAADEILPLSDPRVQRNPAYLSMVLFSRVIVRIGGIEEISPKTIEGLFAADLAHLQDLYNRVNQLDPQSSATCPECHAEFSAEVVRPGG